MISMQDSLNSQEIQMYFEFITYNRGLAKINLIKFRTEV